MDKEPLVRYAQELLLTKMRDISEDDWCAGWMGDLEYDLWSKIHGGDVDWYSLDTQEIVELLDLSRDAGGWWAWDQAAGREVFMPTEEWTRLYAERCEAKGGGR